MNFNGLEDLVKSITTGTLCLSNPRGLSGSAADAILQG
jgi:hypothetical protein